MKKNKKTFKEKLKMKIKFFRPLLVKYIDKNLNKSINFNHKYEYDILKKILKESKNNNLFLTNKILTKIENNFFQNDFEINKDKIKWRINSKENKILLDNFLNNFDIKFIPLKDNIIEKEIILHKNNYEELIIKNEKKYDKFLEIKNNHIKEIEFKKSNEKEKKINEIKSIFKKRLSINNKKNKKIFTHNYNIRNETPMYLKLETKYKIRNRNESEKILKKINLNKSKYYIKNLEKSYIKNLKNKNYEIILNQYKNNFNKKIKLIEKSKEYGKTLNKFVCLKEISEFTTPYLEHKKEIIKKKEKLQTKINTNINKKVIIPIINKKKISNTKINNNSNDEIRKKLENKFNKKKYYIPKIKLRNKNNKFDFSNKDKLIKELSNLDFNADNKYYSMFYISNKYNNKKNINNQYINLIDKKLDLLENYTELI